MDKKSRSANFTAEEEIRLVKLVNKYKKIVENKKTNSYSRIEKLGAWKKITQEFNSAGIYINREMPVLKKKYDNIKKNTKKMLELKRMEAYKIDGGPQDDESINIKDILSESPSGSNSMSDDNLQKIDLVELPTAPEDSALRCSTEFIGCEKPYLARDSAPSCSKWDTKNGPSKEKTKAHSRPLWNELTVEKVKLLKIQQWQSKEKHQLALDAFKEKQLQFKEKHELEMDTLQKESALRIQMLELEVELKKKELKKYQ